MSLIGIFLPLPKLAPQGSWYCFLNSKLGLMVWAENSVTFPPGADGSQQNVVWMMKYWDYRIMHSVLGLQKMKSEWCSKTWDICPLTHKLVFILKPNSKHETISQGQSGQQTPPSSLLIALNNRGSTHVGPVGGVRSHIRGVQFCSFNLTDIFLQALYFCLIASIFPSAH